MCLAPYCVFFCDDVIRHFLISSISILLEIEPSNHYHLTNKDNSLGYFGCFMLKFYGFYLKPHKKDIALQ